MIGTEKTLRKAIKYLINPLKELRGSRKRVEFYRSLDISPRLYCFYEDNERSIPKSIVDKIVSGSLIGKNDPHKFINDVASHNKRLRDIANKYKEFTPIDNLCTHLEYVNFKNGSNEKISYKRLSNLAGFSSATISNIHLGRTGISKNVRSRMVELANKTGYGGDMAHEIDVFNKF